ncbi:DSCAM-like protein [Mya arenaria]|uniref:DSCAM-like protein n=1 Tax=Mya arenaria TaxID=6604 RepID=A0ABY7EA11_MYAAR|nr:DSCAM-like protein [Mya arenaria]
MGSSYIRVLGGRFSMTPEGELHVRDVRDTDGYTDFRCTATSSVADIERSSPPAKLVIHDPPAGGKSPSIEAYPTQSEAVMGSTVQLACVADGWPLPTYRWSRDGHSLNVSDPRYSQFGGDLVIKAPLSAAIIPGHQVQDSGETAVFNCTISGFPLESVMWYRNGRLLDADERLVFRSQTVLEVRGVGRKDQGMYQCFASGGHTETQAAGQLMLGDARPTILDGYGNQLFKQQGDRASIRCVASGNPTPEVTWLLDGQSLKERSHVSVGNFLGQSGDVYSYVNISHVTLLEGGDYRCVATNRLGLADHVSRLNVYGEPYIREMANITATANERLKIKCYVTGYPIAAVSWYRDGRILPLNHLQQVVNGTLTILNVQKLYDAGRYTCIALDPAGHGTERSVYVSVVEPPVIDPFRIPARKQGDRVTLSCAVSSGDLPIYISWTKDGLPVPPDIGITVETSGPYSSLLKIDDVSPLHDGNYTCHAHNEAARTNYTAILHVDVPPSWVVEPQDTSVIRKDLVTLDCHAVGIPEPRITWSENTGGYPPNYLPLDLSDTDRYRMFPNGTLQIRAAMEEDEGYFLCRADNHIGHGISKIIFLRVHVPARFDISEKNYTVSRGQNVSLECQAIGDKPLSVSWHVRNATLGRGTAGSQSFELLVIGVKKFVLKNGAVEPPDAPVNLTLVERGSRHVVLTWARPFDGNSAITEYIIEYQNNSDDARGPVRNLTTSGEAVTARVEGLHPSFLYDIRIRARNSVGLGLTSHQISTRMLEEAPTGPPTEVKATALGSQQLQVTWKPPALEHRNGIMLGYYVGYRETHTSSQLQVITKDVDPGSPVATDGEVSVVVGNLKKFTEYQVHVRGYNKEGQGPPSQDFAVTTLEDVPSQPPEGVHAYASSSQSIRITWGPPPLFTLHGVLQGYKVLYRPVRTNEDETDASSVQVESLDVDLSGLDRYTNYSVQVLAFTRKGEGVRSNPIYVRTMEDVPGRPAGIKAVPASNVSVAVSWRPPTRMNGVLTTYTIYYCNTSTSAQEMKLDVSPTLSSFLLRDLEPGVDYWVRVTASTRMGEGESTQIVTVAPVNDAPARITSFSLEVVVSFQATVLLPCDAIGDPAPSVTWSARYGVIDTTDRHSVLKNGSLYMVAVIGTDADNYTCRAKNKYGSDVITYSLSVQAPPKAPVLSLAAVTSSTIQVNWLSGSNGGSPILGFLLQHRKEHDVWREVHLGARNRTYTASGLLCGIPYKFSITALNSIGRSEQSNVVDTATVGGPPIPPMQDELLRTVNVTSVELDFRSWRRDTTHTVEDLRPATRYVMKVTAYSDAGSAETKLIFATLTYAGSTLEPLYVFRKDEPYFYEKAHIMVPLCVALAIIIAASIALALFCVRRRQIIRYKETSSNIRRDITAETSLMNDLDKRLNCDPGSPADARLHRNVNLLISLHSDDTLSGNNSPWGFHDTSKTTSDNASLERYGTYKTNSDNASLERYGTYKTNSDNASLERYGTYKTNSDNASLERYGTYKTNSDNASLERYGTYKTTSDNAFLERYGTYKTTSDNASLERYGTYKTTSDNASLERYGTYKTNSHNASLERYGTYKTTSDNASLERYGTYKTNSDNASLERYGTYKTNSDNASLERYGTYKTNSDNASLERYGTYKTNSDNASLERYGTYKTNSDNASLERYGTYKTNSDNASLERYGTYKTNSDNASLERYDDNPDINPYATFNDLKLVFSEPPAYHQADPEYAADSISIQKAQAQKAMQLRSEAVKSSRCAAKLPCPPTSNATAAEAHSYDNQAVMLSPRKYASADQIHALFTMAPPRPQSAYSKNRSQGTRSTPSEKGSQRHSLISSVTTVSSSRDELMEAFENLSRNPPPPVVYETEADSLSQPTDSSSEQTVRSPGYVCSLSRRRSPTSDERLRVRSPDMNVPPDSQHYKEPIPPLPRPPEDNFDARTAPRRAARQHCSVQKMKDAPCNNHRQPPQTRGNARPRCIEEVTYMFSGDESPSRARKPTNFDDKLIAVREDRGPSVWRRGGRRTPHARSRYDTTLQTPGSADNKPLVTAQVMATQDETPEDEEAVGLLER